ncbi:MAG: peptidoglycan editing factor PgeF [Hyphomicrobiaceae bacterium]
MDEHLQAPALGRLSGIAHRFFTRQGGVSDGVYQSLNCGPGSSDLPERVGANRGRVASMLGVAADRLLTPWQVHSAEVAVVDRPWTGDRPRVDALVTRTPGLAVAVLTADCAPVLFADIEAGVAAAAHAGWRGARAGVLEATVEAMERLGARRSRIMAAIGPMIGPDSFEVGADFEQELLAGVPESRAFFHFSAGRRSRFDLPGFCRWRLDRAGITGIEVLAVDTYADEQRFFSYRRSTHRKEADYGRQISAIVLK